MENRKELKWYDGKQMKKRLFTYRKIDNNYSMQEMSELIGISKATYSRVENGNSPDIETFIKVCYWLGDDMMDYVKLPQS